MDKNYETIRFGDLATFRNGLNFTSKSNGKGCHFIGVSDFKNRHVPDYDLIGEINPEGIAKEDDYLQRGDILFVRSNGNKELVGRSLYINSTVSALYSGFCIRARISSNQILPEFCAYFAKTDLFKKYISYADGTNINNLNQAILSDVKIPALPLYTQNSIVKVLSNLTSKIELNNRINTELEAIAKLVYEYWFVQFDFPISTEQAAKMSDPTLVGKPYKSSGGKMGWNEELKREIPPEWRSGTISDIASLTRGVTYNKDDIKDEGTAGTIPILRATNITGNQIDLNSMVYVSESLVDKEQILNPFNILITMSSGSIDHIGKNGFYLFKEKVAFGAFCAKMAANEDFEFYLYSYTQSDFFFTTIKNECLGTNINNLNGSMVRGFKLVIPDNSTLTKFNEIVKPLFEKLRINSMQNQQLSSLRDWLLPMLMNGQVTVAWAEERVEEELGMVAEPQETYQTNPNRG